MVNRSREQKQSGTVDFHEDTNVNRACDQHGGNVAPGRHPKEAQARQSEGRQRCDNLAMHRYLDFESLHRIVGEREIDDVANQ
jgi:hypothetical protein